MLCSQVGRALAVNGLGHVSLNQSHRRSKGGARDAVARFKNDPDVKVRGPLRALAHTTPAASSMLSLIAWEVKGRRTRVLSELRMGRRTEIANGCLRDEWGGRLELSRFDHALFSNGCVAVQRV